MSVPASAAEATAIASALLIREGELLDARDWAGWLALYTEDCVYHVPAWRDEYHETSDPDREVSIIYHQGRRGLEERVTRVQSGRSVTALPLPRTTHFVSNVVGEPHEGGVAARASWMVHVYQPDSARRHVLFGRLEAAIVRAGQAWCYRRKTVHLVNDELPALVDFYTL